ncbi:DUF971 domain-containing protein [Thiohalobacter sp. IOR34]|uniref:DUF971 domain-containing protein n=1 Tax=Thiohalobacter sp. IOR34 TaxID=3057176 RepID=UPI0025AFB8FB|nr:DUF971 domain-containing protein [Thiohalobacter sp. IOR34]WJW75572.1 DUF971 domain-containing protein [Thiohalobacter sp. IOR34]
MSMHPTEIKVHTKSRTLEISFESGESFNLPAEYLRVYSPSAEVQGHGPGQGVLQVGKEDVNIENVVPVGNYGVQIYFDDNHNTGIYAWDTLYDLGKNYEQHWQDYLERLAAAGHKRRSPDEII